MTTSSAALNTSTIALIKTDPSIATIAQMQEFSNVIILLKIVFVLGLLGGIIFCWKDNSCGIENKFHDFVFGVVATVSVIAGVIGVIVGCVWVIS